MKKIIDQSRSYFVPAIIICVLIFAMLGPRQLNLFYFWVSFSLLIGMTLWRLRFPSLYIHIIKDKAFLAYAAFILWGILSTLYWSEVKVTSTITVFTFLVGLLSYFVAYTDDRQTTLNVHKLLLLLGGGLALFTCYQFFVLEMKRPIGLLLNWNTHAAILGMLILPWVLRFALTRGMSNAQIYLLSSASFFSAFAMGLTQSRGAVLILASGFVLLFVLIRRQKLAYKPGLFLLVSIILGYFLSSYFVSESLLQRISTIAEVQTYREASVGRHLLWPAAWHMYLDRPFLGWGLESFAALFTQYKFPLHAEYGYYAHNDYLQFLLELGPIGLLLFLSFVFFIVKKLFLVLAIKEGQLETNKIAAFALLATCLGMLVHTFFTFHLYQLSIQVILGYYLGGAAKYIHLAHKDKTESIALGEGIHFKRFYRLAWFVMVITVIITGVASYHINKAEKITDYQLKMDHYLTAGLFFPVLEKHDSLSARYYTNVLQSMSSTGENVKERQQIASYALQAVDSAIEKMPLQKWNYITKAELLREHPDNYSAVRKLYSEALRIDPYLLTERYHYAQFLVESAQHKEALDIMWVGWGLLIKGSYQTGLSFLQLQLELNQKNGRDEDSEIIELQIQRVKELMEHKGGGKYVFFIPDSSDGIRPY